MTAAEQPDLLPITLADMIEEVSLEISYREHSLSWRAAGAGLALQNIKRRRIDRLAPAGFIATYQDITIDGLGHTEEAAFADAARNFRGAHLDPDDVQDILDNIRIAPATAALLAAVEGGAGSTWDYVHGVACLPDEDWEPEYEHEERDAPASGHARSGEP